MQRGLIEHIALNIDALQIENVCCGDIVVAACCAFTNLITPVLYVFESTNIVDATDRQQQANSPAPKGFANMRCSAARSSEKSDTQRWLPDQIQRQCSAHDIDWTIRRIFH